MHNKKSFLIKAELSSKDELGASNVLYNGEIDTQNIQLNDDSVEGLVLRSAIERIRGELNISSSWRDSWKDGGRHVQTWGRGS